MVGLGLLACIRVSAAEYGSLTGEEYGVFSGSEDEREKSAHEEDAVEVEEEEEEEDEDLDPDDRLALQMEKQSTAIRSKPVSRMSGPPKPTEEDSVTGSYST